MRIGFLMDVHVGNHKQHGGETVAGVNARCRLVLEALRTGLRIAADAGCTAVVFGGDLLDVVKPSPQVLAALQDVLAASGLTKLALLGNHEMESTAEGDNALGPLRHLLTVYERPKRVLISARDAVELWAVPYRPGVAAEWLPTVLAEMQGAPSPGSPASSVRVLALHLGLQDGKTPPWLQGSADSIHVNALTELMVKHDITAAFAGNWHDPQAWSFRGARGELRRIVQVGALCPTGWDNPGLRFGSLAIYDTQDEAACVNRVVVPGPRFLTKEAELTELPAGCTPFLSLRVSSEDERVAAEEGMAARGVQGRVVVDAAEEVAGLRQAAGLARRADNIDEALTSYVGALALEEALRPLVLERVRNYLGGAT